MSDLERELRVALDQGFIVPFEIALQNGANPKEYDSDGISIYERCLAKPHCNQFILACLRNGCTEDYFNKELQKAAINYAADSACSDNIVVLLRGSRKVQVDHQYEGRTPLNALAKELTNYNASHVIGAIFELLEYGASPNIPDKNGITPLHYIVMKRDIDEDQRSLLVRRFLQQKDLNIDSYRNGQLREDLKRHYPNLKLPTPCSENGDTVTYDKLLNELTYGTEEKFKIMSANYKADENDALNLLKECIEKGRNQAFDELLKTHGDLDINKGFAGERNMTLAELSVIHGNCHSLDKLLNHQNIKWPSDRQLLIKLIGKLNDEPPVNAHCDYVKCFRLLVKSKLVDANERDESGYTPLHYAAKYHCKLAVDALLAKGAHLGAINEFGEMPLADMDEPKWLEKHLDQCITVPNKRRSGKNFELAMDFKNLDNSLSGIEYMARTKHLRSLLSHPLITSFVLFKWSEICGIVYAHMVIYAFFSLSFLAHAYLRFSNQVKSEWDFLRKTSFYFIHICLLYLLICDIVKLRMSRKGRDVYVHFVINLTMISLSLLSIWATGLAGTETERLLTVYAILFMFIRLSVLLGTLPCYSISTHILMLRKTTTNYVKILVLYSIFFIGFGFSFYILFAKPMTGNEESYHTFSNPFSALIKTIIMATGEFEASQIEFKSFFSYLFFFLFVIVTTLIILNLLTGIAVGDSQTIRADAEINSLICRIMLLHRYEISRPNNSVMAISIYPNQMNKVVIHTKAERVLDIEGSNSIEMRPLALTRTLQQSDKPKRLDTIFQWLKKQNSKWFNCKIDSKTIKRAIGIHHRL